MSGGGHPGQVALAMEACAGCPHCTHADPQDAPMPWPPPSTLPVTPFPSRTLAVAAVVAEALLAPAYWTLDRLLALRPTTGQRASWRRYRAGRWLPVAARVLVAPALVLALLLALPPALLGLLLWLPVQAKRRALLYRYEPTAPAPRPWDARQPRGFTFVTANVCLLPSGLARFSNLGNTRRRADDIGRRLAEGSGQHDRLLECRGGDRRGYGGTVSAAAAPAGPGGDWRVDARTVGHDVVMWPEVQMDVPTLMANSVMANSMMANSMMVNSMMVNQTPMASPMMTNSVMANSMMANSMMANSMMANQTPMASPMMTNSVMANSMMASPMMANSMPMADPTLMTHSMLMSNSMMANPTPMTNTTPMTNPMLMTNSVMTNTTPVTNPTPMTNPWPTADSLPTPESPMTNPTLGPSPPPPPTSPRPQRLKPLPRPMPPVLTTRFPPDADFVCLQEVFDGAAAAALLRRLCRRFPHVLWGVGPGGLRAGRLRLLGSGLVLGSRWPLPAARFHAFPNAAGEDALANKGLLVAQVLLGTRRGRRIVGYLGCTHLQAPAPDATIRDQQLSLVLRWFREFQRDQERPGDLVAFGVLCGDLNFDNCSRGDSDNQKHELFREFWDPARRQPGQDQPWAIGTLLDYLKIHEDPVSSPEKMERTLSDPWGRGQFLAGPILSCGSLDPQATRPWQGRRVDLALVRRDPELTTEVTGYSVITQLATLSDHLPVALRLRLGPADL